MHKAGLARLSFAVVVMTALVFSQSCLAESMSLDLDPLVWQQGQMLPAYCDIPLELGTNVAFVTGISLKVTGIPKEGTMLLCKGGCDSFPCHQTLHAYFLDFRHINTWIPLEGPETGFDITAAMEFADCYPDCFHPCTGKDVSPEDWTFIKDDGTTTLRLQLMGDFEGCGASCSAENGIENITVTVEYEPLIREEYAAWGAMKAVYR